MDGEDFLSDILLNGGDGEVAGLEDLNIPITQDTQEVEVEEVQASRGTNKGSRRAKKISSEGRRSCMCGLVAR
jgi:hypothetical protein